MQDAEERLKNDNRPRSTEEVRKIAHNLEVLHQGQGYPYPEGTDVETEFLAVPATYSPYSSGLAGGAQPPIMQPDPQRFKGRTVTSTPGDLEAEVERLSEGRYGDFAESIRESLPTVESPYYTADPSWGKET